MAWTSYLTFLRSGFFIFKVGLILLPYDFVEMKQTNASTVLSERHWAFVEAVVWDSMSIAIIAVNALTMLGAHKGEK